MSSYGNSSFSLLIIFLSLPPSLPPSLLLSLFLSFSLSFSQAIHKLMVQYEVKNKEDVKKSVFELLEGPPMISARSLAERQLVIKSIELLVYIGPLDSKLTALLMAYSTEGDREIRQLVLGFLGDKGLEDPLGYFTRELDNLVPVSGSETDELVRCSSEWLDAWAEDMFLSKGLKFPKKKESEKRRGSVATSSPAAKTPTAKQKQVVRQTSSLSSLPVYDPVDVINHFVKVAREREFAK